MYHKFIDFDNNYLKSHTYYFLLVNLYTDSAWKPIDLYRKKNKKTFKGSFEFAGRKQNVLEWSARQKIAVGAARGLRYLHEECRVGCIVHRDMRPNNILLTHDFEALVRLILQFQKWTNECSHNGFICCLEQLLTSV